MQTQKNKNDPQSDDRQAISEQASRALRDLTRILADTAASDVDVDVQVEAGSGVVRLPRSVAEVLRQVLASAADGQTVAVIPQQAELTTQQAADMLNVSRPYLIKILDEGQIEYRKVGSHRRITAESLQRYSRQAAHESRKAADELAELAEEMGLYE